MILYPAIDIRGGRAVRLVQGDYDREMVFDADPLDAAKRWVSQGARCLHVVDLDGARDGVPANLRDVARICAETGVPVQCGGGLRDERAVAAVLAAGAHRAVIGTAAQRDPDLLAALVAANGADRIAVAVDARAGSVAVEGWERDSGATVEGLIAALGQRGARRFVYTPIEVDGTLTGPNLEGLRASAEAAGRVGAELIYSGGVGSVQHLRSLAGLGLQALGGVVVGRALYEERFTVTEGQAVLDEVPAEEPGSPRGRRRWPWRWLRSS